MDRFTVHIVGAGHAMRLPLITLITMDEVSGVTIESRNVERLEALLADLGQADPHNAGKIRCRSLRETSPDLLIVAFGRTIRPREDRESLFGENALAVINRLGNKLPGDPLVLVVTNPVDPLVHKLRYTYDIPNEHIAGVGGDLDANRIRWALAAPEAKVLTLGEHSEGAAVLIDDACLESLPDAPRARQTIRTSLHDQLRHLGAPTYCPGIAIAQLLQSILNDAGAIHLLSVWLPTWETAVTWPTRVSRRGFSPVPTALGEDTVARIDEIARKNRLIATTCKVIKQAPAA